VREALTWSATGRGDLVTLDVNVPQAVVKNLAKMAGGGAGDAPKPD